jgi:hypothetical protein
MDFNFIGSELGLTRLYNPDPRNVHWAGGMAAGFASYVPDLA